MTLTTKGRPTPSVERKRAFDAFNKRIAHLSQRIETAKNEGRNLDFDKQERAALKWMRGQYLELIAENEILRREIEALREGDA